MNGESKDRRIRSGTRIKRGIKGAVSREAGNIILADNPINELEVTTDYNLAIGLQADGVNRAIQISTCIKGGVK